MKQKQPEKIVTRVIELPETDWKWICGWLHELVKEVPLEDLTPDLVRMYTILNQLELAKRPDDGDKEAPKKILI